MRQGGAGKSVRSWTSTLSVIDIVAGLCQSESSVTFSLGAGRLAQPMVRGSSAAMAIPAP